MKFSTFVHLGLKYFQVGKFETFLPALQLARENGLKLSIHAAEIYNPDETKVLNQSESQLNLTSGNVGLETRTNWTRSFLGIFGDRASQ